MLQKIGFKKFKNKLMFTQITLDFSDKKNFKMCILYLQKWVN